MECTDDDDDDDDDEAGRWDANRAETPPLTGGRSQQYCAICTLLQMAFMFMGQHAVNSAGQAGRGVEGIAHCRARIGQLRYD
jgi:hypothetical protein